MQYEIANRLGKIVRAERERQGLKQDELALTADVSYRTVLQIEKGKPTSRLDVLVRVLEALGLTLEVRAAPRSLARSPNSPLSRFEIYRDASGSYRWRLRAANGEVLASSAESYSSRSGAQSAARHVAATAGAAEVVLK